MSVSFSEPLRSAFERTARVLFRPFALEKWLVVGFAAWLAGAPGAGTGGFQFTVPLDDLAADREAAVTRAASLGGYGAAAEADPLSGLAAQLDELTRFLDGPEPWVAFFLGCGAVVIAALLILVVVLLWLGSRFSFVFLDDVVRDRSEIVAPWRRYGRIGNSLFLWRLAYLAVVLLVMGSAVVAGVASASLGSPLVFGPLLLCLALLVPAAVYVDVMLRHFVVPLMYKHELTATAAWGRFLPLLRASPVPFLVYGLLLVALWMGVGTAVLVTGVFTCCLGVVLVALPYVGTVVLLPVHVFFRLFGVDFLAQFGPEFDLRPLYGERAAGAPGEAPAAGGPDSA